MKEQPIEIKLALENIVNVFLEHLKETTNCVTHIYHSIEESNIDLSKPLPTESFPLKINNNKPALTIKEQKIVSFEWVVRKAFEDFINGLTMSLKEANKIIETLLLSEKPKYSMTKEEIENELEKINVKIEKLHFPELVKSIEDYLSCSLRFSEEIISINKIRNCLVHRNGVVSDKDVRNNRDLELKWISLKWYTLIENISTEITYDMRKNGITVSNLEYKVIDNRKSFEKGQKISIDINEFNGIAYTCSEFARFLYSSIPFQNNN